MNYQDHPIYQKYQSIMPPVTDPNLWCSRLPKTFWVNTLRISIAEFQKIVMEEGLDCQPLSWNAQAYRAGKDFTPTKHWIFAAGLIQMQEEAAMHCAYLLNPQPQQIVLDTCAAPGNKSAQMAVMMQNKGTLIVNDMNYGRMRAFGQISKRLGLVNISSAIYNAANLPKMPELFDAIMVDVPCSCEGTYRKKWPKLVNPVSDNQSKAQAKRQLAILNKAIQLAKPGARLVYSTCTFSPYENEAVITKALQKWGDCIEILPIEIPGFTFSAGVTKWQDEGFANECKKTARIWPQQNNTGGFFMALIRKTKSHQVKPWQTECVEITNKALDLKPLQNRFAFAEDILQQFVYHQPTTKGWYISAKPTKFPANIKLDASGMFFYKTAIQFPKLSTAAAMLIGKYAAKNKVTLTASQRDAYFNKQDVELTSEQISLISDTGYVLVFYQQFCLGVGLYFSPNEHQPLHRLRSLVDKKLFQ